MPTELGNDEVTSSERRVFDSLASGGLRGTALHSLNLPEHAYKRTGELDFVLVLEDLILVIEVKGGQVSCHDRVWTYRDRAGHHRTSREGPFNQAQSGMYALRDRLRTRVGHAVDDIAFGYLVVTPDVDIPSGFEWADETYCGRGPYNRGLDRAIERAQAYWLAKEPRRFVIDSNLHSRLMHDLRPSFDQSPLLDARASALEASMVRLTDEQYSRLDLISEEPRVICSGGAGTGKTFLATEVARRQSLVGRRVLFTCRSTVLAAFVKELLAGTSVDVMAIDEIPVSGSYDVLVVDEAQDLMTFDILNDLESVIAGGWADGRWVMFLDQNAQAHFYGDFDTDALQYVESFHPVRPTLKFNCRNTREIAFQTRAYTGADTGVATAGAGPEVIYANISNRQSETAALEAHLRTLRENEVRPGNITIVSVRGDWESSAAKGLRDFRKGRLERVTPERAANWPGTSMSWASAIDVKGMENRFVCVIDIDSVTSEKEANLLYVALSRPRAGLWVAVTSEVGDQLKGLFKLHSASALEAYKKAKV
ncbi:nuclease-related domain-containing DEAD/DEAH box helicase [Rhodococcus sp. 114MFTsu3.1]|uniref:nuclease-related domain-containing DEAD/DEAH box helicase n=1 Tax=Rhodococcus sp. 114MFTsu3.1 TaxID=1172184 RepID=UPI0018C93206|nr:NERD domain-containing protein [Rhodococcus sp. 114MFTsu3.1]